MVQYNGWANYETWSAALWLDNDGSGEIFRERAQELAQEAIDNDDEVAAYVAEKLADEIEGYFGEQYDEISERVSGFFADQCAAAWRAVDWREIAEHYTNDLETWAVGWNMPGYMPDNPPAVFLDYDDACSYIADEIDRAAEEDNADYSEIEATAREGWDGKDFHIAAGNYVYFVSKQ